MDLERIAVRSGMVLSISVAALTGSPIAGALIQTGNGSYLYVQCFATFIMLAETTLVIVARICNTGLKLKAGM
jgi:asparagine N-glycosylation enzyme membrane subunit Stt3